MIYFIEAAGAGLVKIGFTEREVEDRLRELQTASPHKLRIRAAIPGTLQSEAQWHQQFEHLRTVGEWFSIDGELQATMVVLRITKPLSERLDDLITKMHNFRNHYAITPVMSDSDPDDVMYADEIISGIDDRVQRIEASLAILGRVFVGAI